MATPSNYNSAITIVANVANTASTNATQALADSAQALTEAQSAQADATYAKNRITRFVGDQNTFYDNPPPSASVLVGSKANPILAKPTANRTWTYTYSDLVSAGYATTNGVASDLIKVINIGQSYTLKLALSNSGGGISYEYTVQPGETILAFYNGAGGGGGGEWIYCASVI